MRPANNRVRLTRSELWVEQAKLYARRSTCPRAHVGCVIVRNKRAIAAGYNGAPPGLPHCEDVGCDQPMEWSTRGVMEGGPVWQPSQGCRRAVHAEANAIAHAARFGISIVGGVLYCTHEPCMPCSQLLVSAGIAGVYWAEDYKRNSGQELLRQAGVELIGL